MQVENKKALKTAFFAEFKALFIMPRAGIEPA
jgi:hypothetical protein